MPRKLKGNKQARPSSTRVPATLSDGPAYAGQQKVVLRLPGTPAILSTTVTTGVIASTIGLAPTSTQNFAARFGSTFDEMRLLGVDVKIRPVTASTGITVFYFDEKNTSAPALVDAQERIGLRLANTNASPKSSALMRWRARDLLDLEYTAIGSAASTVNFKAYTNTAEFGAPTAVTNLWLLEFVLIVEFKGIKAA